MRKSIAISIVSVLLAVLPVFGGPLVKSNVSAEADWVVHLNYDQLVKSQTGQLIRAELAKMGLEEKLQVFEQVFSFHPIDDVRNATLYGIGDDEQKVVALIEGNFDREKLVSMVRMNPEYQQSEHAGIAIHSWVDENKKDPNKPGKRTFGCIPRDNLVVMGGGLEMVKKAVDVLKGSAPNAAVGTFDHTVLTAEGAFFQIAANAVADIAGNEPKAALLKQAEALGGVVGEDDGKFYVNLSLRAGSDEVAKNLKTVLDGIFALFALAGDEQPLLAELAKRLSVSNVDRTVTVYFEEDPQTIVSFLKKQWAADRQKKIQTAQ